MTCWQYGNTYSIECDKNVAYCPGGSNGILKGNVMCSYLLKPEPVNKPVIIAISYKLQNRSIQGCIINATQRGRKNVMLETHRLVVQASEAKCQSAFNACCLCFCPKKKTAVSMYTTPTIPHHRVPPVNWTCLIQQRYILSVQVTVIRHFFEKNV